MLVAYLYDEIRMSRTRPAFDRHLTTCAPCRAELAALRWCPIGTGKLDAARAGRAVIAFDGAAAIRAIRQSERQRRDARSCRRGRRWRRRRCFSASRRVSPISTSRTRRTASRSERAGAQPSADEPRGGGAPRRSTPRRIGRPGRTIWRRSKQQIRSGDARPASDGRSAPAACQTTTRCCVECGS